MFKDFNAFKIAIKDCGIPTAEAEFKKSTVHPPYACYFRSAENNICADGKPVISKTQIAVELYTEKSDNTSEMKLEEWFKNVGIQAQKTERAFIAEVNYYETVYEFELIFR